MNRTFFSWVPTITGHLSFSTIGLSRTPEKIFQAYRQTNGERYVLVCQRRPTGDSISPLVDWWLERERNLYFVFFGFCAIDTKYNIIEGPCYIFPSEPFSSVKKEIERFARLDEPGSSDAERLIAALEGRIRDAGCLSSGIRLERNGKIEIVVRNDGAALDSEIVEASASQFYFFLRDVCHRHQHHSPTADTILDVVPSNGFDAEWKREILYALYRWIIHRRRERSLLHYINAQGVLAYAKAFKALHVGKSDYLSESVPQYLDESVEKSIEAGSKSTKRYVDRSDRFDGYLLTVLLFFFTYLLAVTGYVALQHRFRILTDAGQAAGESTRQAQLFLSIGDFIVAYPASLVLAPLFFVIFYFFADFGAFFNLSSSDRFKFASKFILNWGRVMFALPQAAALMISLAITAGLLLIALSLLQLAFLVGA